MKRDYITAADKRSVRQRCGFGCVFCGSPIFEYEHIFGHQVTGADPAHLTLLCKFHHGEKTHNRMTVSRVQKANAAPYNLGKGLGNTHPLFFEDHKFRVVFGNMDAPNEILEGGKYAALRVDGQPIVGAHLVDGQLELELLLRNENNAPYLVVHKGQLRHTVDQFDIEWVAQTLTIRRALGDVVLRIRFAPPGEVIIERGEIWANGFFFRIGIASKNGGLEFVNDNSSVSGLSIVGGGTGFSYGNDRSGRSATFRSDAERWWGGPPAPVGAFRGV